ncbi:MAG: hypothetical protein IPL53_21295 [Ignavibacteria bacterium]|nr:hypothetical protein [Ignavibacteria bacterium]
MFRIPELRFPAGVSEDSFVVSILAYENAAADLQINVKADFYYDGEEYLDREIQLFTSFALEFDTDDKGNQSNARLRIELIDIDGLFIIIALAVAGITKEDAIEKMKPFFDRSIDTGMVGQDKNVQSVFMKKHEGDSSHPDAIGLYLNLKLKKGPEADNFLDDRGDLNNAENFLPDGDDIAFGMPGSIYPKISKDAFERMAEETSEGSGVFNHPIHEDPSNKDSDTIGKIKNITITTQSGNLIIDVHGEYFIDIIPDPDFHLYITLIPIINKGLIDWKMEYDVDLNPFLEIASFILLIILSALLGPAGFIAGGIIAGIVFTGQEFVVEPWLANAVKEKGDSLIDASFFDAIPNRLTIERKRWDPFYITRHQIVAKTDALQITRSGIGFSGKALLDKQPEAVTHVVIRDEERDEFGTIKKLWYRVKDHAKQENDFVSIFPATDRQEFEKVTDPKGETNLFSITISDAENRVKEFRLPALILYKAKKVYIVRSQTDGILAITQKEINELESDLKYVFKEAEKERIKTEKGDELRKEAIAELKDELEKDPTDKQTEDRLNEKLSKLAEEPLKIYIDEKLDADLNQKIEETLRFDLPPQEMSDLQSRKILFLSSFVIIKRKGTPYYRDRKDLSKKDNLMSLPRYKPEK